MAEAIPYVLGVVSVASTVYSAVSSSQAKSDAERTVKHQEMRAAERARIVAAQAAADEEKRHRAILGTQEARFGASGLTMEGSPLLVQMESLKESQIQLNRIKEGGEINYMTAQELAQAAGKRAEEAQASGYVNAIGSAATGTYKYGKAFDWW